MKKQILLTITFILFIVFTYAQGTITNIRVEQGTGNDIRMVDILFNLSGTDELYDIALEVSFDDGNNFVAIDPSDVTGNLTVAPSNDINLVWDGSISYSGESSNFSRIKITATTHILAIGDYYQGGVVFYLDGNGGGLICAINDQDGGSGIQWYNGSYTTTGATETDIGTGQANTTAIIDNQGAGSYAAKVCDNYTVGSYSDWFLPSKDELNEMYQNREAINTTAQANSGSAFKFAWYWSSSEFDDAQAWVQDLMMGTQLSGSKGSVVMVRAVRAF